MAEANTRTEKFKAYRVEIKKDSYYGISSNHAPKKVKEPKQEIENPEKSKENGFIRNYVVKKRLKLILYILFVAAFVGLLLFLLIYFGEIFLSF